MRPRTPASPAAVRTPATPPACAHVAVPLQAPCSVGCGGRSLPSRSPSPSCLPRPGGCCRTTWLRMSYARCTFALSSPKDRWFVNPPTSPATHLPARHPVAPRGRQIRCRHLARPPCARSTAHDASSVAIPHNPTTHPNGRSPTVQPPNPRPSPCPRPSPAHTPATSSGAHAPPRSRSARYSPAPSTGCTEP